MQYSKTLFSVMHLRQLNEKEQLFNGYFSAARLSTVGMAGCRHGAALPLVH